MKNTGFHRTLIELLFLELMLGIRILGLLAVFRFQLVWNNYRNCVNLTATAGGIKRIQRCICFLVLKVLAEEYDCTSLHDVNLQTLPFRKLIANNQKKTKICDDFFKFLKEVTNFWKKLTNFCKKDLWLL